MSQKSAVQDKNQVVSFLKGVLFAIIATLIMVLLFALIVKLTNMGEGVIKPINQVLKVLGIFIGCRAGLVSKERGFVKGAVMGLVITIVSMLVFSVIAASFAFSWTILLDCAFGMISGGICGIIVVNVKKFK